MRNNKYPKIIMLIALLSLSLFLLQACTAINPVVESEVSQGEDDITLDEPIAMETIEESPNPEIPAESTPAIPQDDPVPNIPNNGLTQDEVNGLVFMREEEKLAKDVYLGLYELWGIPSFENIASSEQTHTDAVKTLLDKYEIEDPADTSPTGVFANQDLQKLYDDLMTLGAQSPDDALKVGCAIEEIDILDLQDNLEITQNDDIRRVYENLLRGSENHLRAFTSNLERQTGETYIPQYLNQAAYDAILSGSSSRGVRGNRNRP